MQIRQQKKPQMQAAEDQQLKQENSRQQASAGEHAQEAKENCKSEYEQLQKVNGGSTGRARQSAVAWRSTHEELADD